MQGEGRSHHPPRGSDGLPREPASGSALDGWGHAGRPCNGAGRRRV